jgi:hypothetical protein
MNSISSEDNNDKRRFLFMEMTDDRRITWKEYNASELFFYITQSIHFYQDKKNNYQQISSSFKRRHSQSNDDHQETNDHNDPIMTQNANNVSNESFQSTIKTQISNIGNLGTKISIKNERKFSVGSSLPHSNDGVVNHLQLRQVVANDSHKLSSKAIRHERIPSIDSIHSQSQLHSSFLDYVPGYKSFQSQWHKYTHCSRLFSDDSQSNDHFHGHHSFHFNHGDVTNPILSPLRSSNNIFSINHHPIRESYDTEQHSDFDSDDDNEVENLHINQTHTGSLHSMNSYYEYATKLRLKTNRFLRSMKEKNLSITGLERKEKLRNISKYDLERLFLSCLTHPNRDFYIHVSVCRFNSYG